MTNHVQTSLVLKGVLGAIVTAVQIDIGVLSELDNSLSAGIAVAEQADISVAVGGNNALNLVQAEGVLSQSVVLILGTVGNHDVTVVGLNVQAADIVISDAERTER